MGGDESGSVCTTLRTFRTAKFQPYSNSAGALRVSTRGHKHFPEESKSRVETTFNEHLKEFVKFLDRKTAFVAPLVCSLASA